MKTKVYYSLARVLKTSECGVAATRGTRADEREVHSSEATSLCGAGGGAGMSG